MSVANEANIAETLLPLVPDSSSVRTETGTTEISGSSGMPPWSAGSSAAFPSTARG